jgi:glutamate racemase|nr:glutamate racemase [uncultured Caldimonas sp.]
MHDEIHTLPVTVGVFDSGVGGLSVLRALRRRLPATPLVYVADSGFAPYGERGDDYVVARCRFITEFLQQQGARILVMACNTATAAAGKLLREAHPELTIVGVEPGVKPAVAQSQKRCIGVLATSGTLTSTKFQTLLDGFRNEAQIHLQPCPGLAHAIEQGDPHATQVSELVHRYCTPLRDAGVDTVVLGCTHYPFVAETIQRALGPEVRLIDTADAVARHTAGLLEKIQSAPAASAAAHPVQLYTSADVTRMQRIAAQWLDFPVRVSPLPAA